MSCPSFSRASFAARLTPYPVASVLASDPQNPKGLPVNVPGADFLTTPS